MARGEAADEGTGFGVVIIIGEAAFRGINLLATTKPAINAIARQVTKDIKLIISFHLSMLIIFHY
ncbi:TPA: hypothetical protein GF202_12495 [Escherichia albertii]|nr:hypothetical protein [Escherichia albertii]HAH3043435.1 hypothetical protein [Escherichia albertii]HAH3052446.1 hypothetical protein [Escherichia albertii]